MRYFFTICFTEFILKSNESHEASTQESHTKNAMLFFMQRVLVQKEMFLIDITITPIAVKLNHKISITLKIILNLLLGISEKTIISAII